MVGSARTSVAGALFSGLILLAFSETSLAQQKAAPAPPQKAAQAPAATSTRTEILQFDGWTVTCQDGAAGAKKACSALLRIVQNDAQNQPRVVFTWVIGQRDGKLLSALNVPTGVQIAPGVEVKTGAKDAKKHGFANCQPAQCEVVIPMDDAFIKDASASPTTDVSVVAIDGRTVKFSVNMKGFDKAVAELRK